MPTVTNQILVVVVVQKKGSLVRVTCIYLPGMLLLLQLAVSTFCRSNILLMRSETHQLTV